MRHQATPNHYVSFCNMFANFFVSKIDSFKSATTLQLIHIGPNKKTFASGLFLIEI